MAYLGLDRLELSLGLLAILAEVLGLTLGDAALLLLLLDVARPVCVTRAHPPPPAAAAAVHALE
jgi:hypothetical protein